MKHAQIVAALLLTLSVACGIPTADDYNCGLGIQGATGSTTMDITWFAKKDHYYFVKQTSNLRSKEWTYFPYAVKGSDGPEGIEIESNNDLMLFRLVFTEDPDDPMLHQDFDGDKVINIHELDKGYNLYDNSDSDSDSLPDDWEQHYFQALNHDSDDDVDGDGFSNATEFLFDTDPSKNYANEAARLSVDTRILNTGPTEAIKIFTEQDHANATYVRNPNCWAQNIEDITAISPWNSRQGRHRAGTLISPRHIIYAAHYPLYNNDKVRFVDKNNNIVERTIIAHQKHPLYLGSAGGYQHDLHVALLDSDVPSEIKFAKVLPDNWFDYLGDIYRIPALCLDFEEKALVNDFYNGINAQWLRHTVPTNPQRNRYYESKITGDSGNPAFIILNSELIITNVWTWGGAGGGTSIFFEKEVINQIMKDLGGGYQLTEFDLSTFKKLEVNTNTLDHYTTEVDNDEYPFLGEP